VEKPKQSSNTLAKARVVDSPAGRGEADGSISPAPKLASEVLRRLDELVQRGELGSIAPLPTGFHPLDRFLDGGVRPGELILVGGAQGVGKTSMTLQMARNLVVQAQAACGYVCFEHDEAFLLQRLVSMESLIGRGKLDPDGLPITELRELLLAAGRSRDYMGEATVEVALAGHAAATMALSRIRTFGERLYLLKASGSTTDVPALRHLVREWKERHGPRVVLFVDYLQKVPVFPPTNDEGEKVTQVADALKELALSEGVAIVAVVAGDREGLRARRLRIHHLRGSSSLMYESDIVLILNNKYRIVARENITYNPHRAKDYKNWVVCTIEKNRAGRDLIDLEFRSFFAFGAFDPEGGAVAEQLLDERIHEE